jgi:hypothetical protein
MDSKTIKLESPITRGEQVIKSITIRKPNAGAMRGCSLGGLLRMEFDQLSIILPRISEPTLTQADVMKMDAVDLTQVALELTAFLVPKSQLENFQSE